MQAEVKMNPMEITIVVQSSVFTPQIYHKDLERPKRYLPFGREISEKLRSETKATFVYGNADKRAVETQSGALREMALTQLPINY